MTDLDVPSSALDRFQPFGETLERVGGGLINPDAVKLIDSVIRTLAPPGSEQLRWFEQAARCLMPPVETFERMLEDAWGVLDGHPGATHHYRATLGLLGGGSGAEDRAALTKRGARLLERCSCGATSTQLKVRDLAGDLRQPSHNDPGSRSSASAGNGFAFSAVSSRRLCLVPRERLIPAWMATFRIAQNAEDAAFLVGALEAGLCGVGRMQMVLTAATETLATGDTRGLEGLLTHFGKGCGLDGQGPLLPERGPRPGCPEPPDFGEALPDICDVGPIDDCLIQIGSAAQRSTSPPYVVHSISDIHACPGTTITIIGTNFGTVPGLVCFPFGSFAPGGTCVNATSWTDTEIQVVVPAGAGAGELSLKILESTVFVCGVLLGISREGEGNRTFVGGRAAISSFSVARGQQCIEPGAIAQISWVASQGGIGTSVRLLIEEGTNVLLDQGVPDRGTFAFAVPRFATEHTLTFTLEATNTCGNATASRQLLVTVVPVLTIEGLEITQGIQTFLRPGVPSNSLATIAGKDTIVRVYVSCFRKGFLNDRIADVTGSLRVGTVDLMPINGISPAAPGTGNPFISVGPANQIDRQQTDHTLNFRIPAALCSGTQSLDVRVTGPAMCGVNPTARAFSNWTWSTEPALKVRFVKIRDDRSGGTGMQPTDTQARLTVDRAFDLLPTPATDIGPARTAELPTTSDFTTLTGLQDLLREVEERHACDLWEWITQGLDIGTDCPPEDEALWIGLTVPFNRGLGWRPGDTCIGAIHTLAGGQGEFQRTTPAHELAHNLDFMHVNRSCGGSVGGPFYSHPDNGDLQDVPFDPFWNVAIGGTVQDFMSYGCVVWTSGDSWLRLRNTI